MIIDIIDSLRKDYKQGRFVVRCTQCGVVFNETYEPRDFLQLWRRPLEIMCGYCNEGVLTAYWNGLGDLQGKNDGQYRRN